MGNKIKIALCLSGEPRSTMASFPYIYESFLQNNPIFETDVYIHAWKGFRALKMYNPKKSYIDSNVYETNLFTDYFLQANLPKSIESQMGNFGFDLKTNYKLKNTFLMFYSFNRCFNLIEDSYDLFIKCRYDTFFENKFYIDSILMDILKNKYDIFIPYNKTKKSHELLKLHELNSKYVDDGIAIGNYNSFKAYSNTLFDLNNLLNQSQTLDPHRLLATQLKNYKIKIFQSYISLNIIRKSNIIADNKNFIFNDE